MKLERLDLAMAKEIYKRRLEQKSNLFKHSLLINLFNNYTFKFYIFLPRTRCLPKSCKSWRLEELLW